MKSTKINEMKLTLPALSVNEGVARAMVGAFCAQLNPTVEEVADLKCAVSEAVTNAIVHGYREKSGQVQITLRILEGNIAYVKVRDNGCGIADIEREWSRCIPPRRRKNVPVSALRSCRPLWIKSKYIRPWAKVPPSP